ncbi:MAG TPA: hypothetical protein VM537_12175 [Anaerolineae bacterium]|nr:hypothetical protein [Anaerolineae bacterium]
MENQQQKPKLVGYVEPVREFEGYSLLGYYARGHVDPSDVIAAVEHDYGERYDLSKVRQTYARNVPVGPDRPEEMVMCTDVKPGRGAYKITWLETW